MGVPSVVKFTKNGIEYTSSVDRANYTIRELIRAALKDTGKYVCRETRKKIHRKTGRVAKNTQYWVRSKDGDLQVGFKPGGFYGGFQELGTSKQPKIGALYNSVSENIAQIQEIQGKYLSAIEDENTALGLIDEGEEIGDNE